MPQPRGRARLLSCLEPDPARRPASALEVRAALPGGDPLASAVARGRTPAPDLVAEATEGGSLRPAMAWTCLGYVLLAVPLVVWMSGRSSLNQVVPLPKSPAVLAAEARETLASLGYPPPRDTSYGFVRHTDYIDGLMAKERSDDWLDLLRRGEPSVVRFWCRERTMYLVPHRITEFPMTELDPPLSSPGMIHVELDPCPSPGPATAARVHRPRFSPRIRLQSRQYDTPLVRYRRRYRNRHAPHAP